jgi:hypothetical protein
MALSGREWLLPPIELQGLEKPSLPKFTILGLE